MNPPPFSPFSLFYAIDADPARAGEIARMLAEYESHVRAEEGSLLCNAHAVAGRPGRFFLYEQYAGAGAFGQHLAGDPSAEFFGRLAPLTSSGTLNPISLVPVEPPDDPLRRGAGPR